MIQTRGFVHQVGPAGMPFSAAEVNSRAIIYSNSPLDYSAPRSQPTGMYPIQAVRIFVLHPGSHNQPLRGHLVPQDLNVPNHLPYAALSYAGGDMTTSTGLQPIIVNDRRISISSNLHAALMHIRRASNPRYLWIDALCVDQLCIPDKSYHVPLVGKIYRQAEEVVAWLGECDENYGCVTLEKLRTDCAGSAEAIRFIASDEWKDHSPRPETAAALDKFFARPFWKRAWVVQELYYANHVTFWCGPLTLPWVKMEEYLMTEQMSGRELPTSTNRYARILFDLADKITHRIYRFFAETAHLEATLPIDRVYGVLGLLHHEYGIMMEPSYHKTYQGVMVELLRASLSLEGNLDMLTCFGPLARQEEEEDAAATAAAAANAAPLRLRQRCLTTYYHPTTTCPTFAPTIMKPVQGLDDKYNTPGWRKAPNCWVGDSALTAKGFVISTIVSTQGPFLTEARRVKERLAKDLLPTTGKSLVRFRDTAMKHLGNMFPRASRDEQSSMFFAMVAGKKQFAHETEPFRPVCENVWECMEQLETDSYDGKMAELVDAFAYWFDQLDGRSFFTTASGHVGLGRDEVQPGDLACVLFGCRLPVVLRPVPNTAAAKGGDGGSKGGGDADDVMKLFTFHGGAYVEGLMDGERYFAHDAGCGQENTMFFNIV